MNYVSQHNLEIIDTNINKIRKVKYLEKASYFNSTLCRYENTVNITFEDNTNVIFVPNRFAMVNK